MRIRSRSGFAALIAVPMALCFCSTAASMERRAIADTAAAEQNPLDSTLLHRRNEQRDLARIDRLRMHADAGRDADALTALLVEAQKGSVEAQRSVGEVLVRRADVVAVQQGLNWLERAAAQGDQRAMLALGKAWLFGVPSVAPDHIKARGWFERVDPQNAQAAYYLGLIERANNGGSMNHASAMKRFQFAAERGIPDAMYLLGNGYAHGEGVDHDPREAMRWYMRAAYLDHPQAIQELAYAFARGDTLLPQSDLQAANMRAAIAHALRHPKTAP